VQPDIAPGSEICKGTTAFVFILWGNYNGVDNVGMCYDGGTGSITIPKQDVGQLVVALDNQTGARIWLAGDTLGNVPFNFCYDTGYDFALGGGVDGGDGYEILDVDSIGQGSNLGCTGVPTSSIGSSEPYTSPWVNSYCATGDVQGQHLFIATSYSALELGETNYFCYNNTPHTYTNSLPSGLPVIFIANGTGHDLLISGPGFSTCVDNAHVINPVVSSIDQKITTITVTNGPVTCPS
jgi:hypothetical protein